MQDEQNQTGTPAPAPAPVQTAAVAGNTNSIKLSYPIINGSNTITEVSLRKPKAGELRGLKLVELAQGDWDSICELLPRISAPCLSKQLSAELDLVDVAKIALAINNFFEQPSPQ